MLFRSLNIIGGGSENIKNNKDILEINDNLILERDYDNKYDENAIEIICKKNGNIYHLGYVPRYYAKELQTGYIFVINSKLPHIN